MKYKKIENIINEELGISDEVFNLAKKIEKILYKLIIKGSENTLFKINTDFSPLTVNFTHKDFNTEKEAKLWKKTNGITKYSHSENILYISIASVNGKLNFYSLSDAIQHECYHFFESQKWKKEPFNETIIIHGINSNNKAISTICTILYFSIEDEIDAFCNGTYASAMKKKIKYHSYKEFIYDNKAFDVYYFLSNAKFIIENINEEQKQKALIWTSEYILGCDYEKAYDLIIKIANTAYHYFLKRIGKVYSLYKSKLNYN